MDKYFVCLANSYKHGGRCIAGIEFYQDNGKWRIAKDNHQRPLWIRPTSSSTVTGEIPNDEANGIQIFDVLKLSDATPCPHGAQTENYLYHDMSTTGIHYKPQNVLLQRFADHSHDMLFYDHKKAVAHDIFDNILEYSIVLIHIDNAIVYQNPEKIDYPHYRINFGYNNCQYDLPITDPEYIQLLTNQTIKIGRKENLFVTCSLGMEYEGDHFKIAAAIFETELTKTIEIPYEHVMEGTSDEDQPTTSNNSDWFASYNNELEDLLAQKKEIENRITTLRTQIRQEMEANCNNTVESTSLKITYIPAKNITKFDSKTFQAENPELYSKYCKIDFRTASIRIETKHKNQ